MERELTRKQKAYRAYLKTEHWKDLRLRALQRDGFKCQMDLGEGMICEDTERLHVHHLRYRKRWEDTQLRDLTTRCNDCHRIEHGKVVWFPFDFLRRELWEGLERHDPLIFPTREQEKQLVAEVLNEEMAQQAVILFRMCAIFKLPRTGTEWNRKMSLKIWPWAKRKFERIVEDNKINPPKEYLPPYVRKAL